MRRLKHVLLGICVLAAGVVRGTAGQVDFLRDAIAGGGEGRLGSRQSLPRDDLLASESASTGCGSGSRHLLSMLVVAMPLSAVQMSFSDTNSAAERFLSRSTGRVG